MTAGFNSQYQQYQPYQQPGYSSAAVPGANAVNIQIFNPSAYAAPTTQYAMQPAIPMYQTSSIYGAQGQTPAASYPMNYNTPIQQQSSIYNNQVLSNDKESEAKTKEEPAAKETKDKNEKQEKKEKVILTDEYIKTLENYLNNNDPKIRLSAAKELLDRFKEDESRKADPALCALLNKVIQDPKASVRYVGLTTLDVGYAQGNNETVEILKQMQNRSDLEYGEDATLAAQLLLKMAGQKVEVPSTPVKNQEAA